MANNNSYTNDSITALVGPDRVRKKPAAILGSDGLEGCQHTFIEILANSIDEAREGYGKVIEITRFKDKSIQIRDYGRGCPVDYNEKEKRFNWELVFCELYAGGKYKDDGKDPNPMAKGMSWMKTNVKLAMNESDHTIADLITDGCNMGVKPLSRYLNQYAAADETSKDICKRLIKLEEDLSVKMRDYL